MAISLKLLRLLLAAAVVFSLPFSAKSIPSKAINAASEILTNANFTSMALTLEFVAPQTQIPNSPTVTIFAPPDAAFARSGQPSLSTFNFHVVPLAFTFQSLRALPTGAKLPTMSGRSLIVTSSGSDQPLTINNVAVNGSPLFNDGFLVIYAVDDFFDPNFIPSPHSSAGCASASQGTIPGRGEFSEATQLMRSRGYRVMASFLDLQLLLLLGFNNNQTKLTVLAPADEVMETLIGSVDDYASLFLRHVIPCKLTWIDIADLGHGVSLRTYLDGFVIRLTRFTATFSESADSVMLNEAQVVVPDLYQSDWLVVHGLNDILMVTDDYGPREPDAAEVDFTFDGATKKQSKHDGGGEF